MEQGDGSPGFSIAGLTACHEAVGSTSAAVPTTLDAVFLRCLYLLH